MWHRASSIELKITGMTCEHCAQHVEDEITAAGAQRVHIDLHPQEVSTVKAVFRRVPSDEDLLAAVARAGDYTVVDIAR